MVWVTSKRANQGLYLELLVVHTLNMNFLKWSENELQDYPGKENVVRLGQNKARKQRKDNNTWPRDNTASAVDCRS